MLSLDKLFSIASEIEKKIGLNFKDKKILIQAFVHRSYVNENRSLELDHNERLEYLGDTVLNLIITEHLYKQFLDDTEGALSAKRAMLVDADSCAQYLKKLGLEEFPLLGKGEQRNEGKGRESILSDLFEALIGALYLDLGFDKTRHFIFDHFKESFAEILDNPSHNYKAELQDYAQRTLGVQPDYILIDEEGPDHSKIFTISVMIQNENYGEGKGSSKKIAEQEAAKKALERIDEN